MKRLILENPKTLSIEDPAPAPAGGGDPPKPAIAGAPEKPVAPAVPEKYTFAKIGEAGKEADVPEATAKSVSEFAKTHKLTQEQAQAFMNHTLANPAVEIPKEYTFAKVKDEKGAEVDVAKEVSEPVAAFAKEQGLTQAQAQKLLDRELQLTADASKQFEDQTKAMQTKWLEDARKDPVLGAGNFDENLGVAKVALKQFFPGLLDNISDHVFLDHPVILRGLFDIGKKLSPDGSFVGGKPPEGEKDPARAMYPSMYKK